MNQKSGNNLFLALGIFLGLTLLGVVLSKAAISIKEYERTVTVKGLSEREVLADLVIWPIQFSAASNDLKQLYESLDANAKSISSFLETNGINQKDISFASPSITDKSAQQWGNEGRAEFRYTARQNVTVYSKEIELVRQVMSKLSELGKQGIVLTAGDYQSQTEYIYANLNKIKPEMVEEATKNAREVANKFAEDSSSSLGKIKRASQGQFSISARDKNNPHIKKIRVVSTVEYYLSD
ncbi:SIMPL domain-containing protein [Thalassotalea marina]|uniref:SIMPL domain-containing protein n=1 Tax=Thalassotalea marina TaxID=1673741 RepID=A0A919BDR9_9GAMM|nr:SIMPL domain-containing protein [Thalassotalea marina]GHF84689.1 SIMPL domain-containing protein [Thalassotalea marina]